MKKTLLYSAIALGALSMTTSCGDSFLSLDPVASVSEGTLTTVQGVDYVLTGAYSTFNNMTQGHWMGAASLSNFVFGDVVGADANKGSQSSDQPDFTSLEVFKFNDGNSYISGKWLGIYESVKRANNVIDMATKIQDQLPNYDQIIGQALFIKSVWLFEGIKMYGAAIPYVSLEDYQSGTDPQVSNVDDSGNYVYIWNKVEADLKEAISKLPETWGANNYGRVTSWMAKAMLAKLYLYWSSPYNGTNATADHWNDAKTLFLDIINNGKDAKGQKYKLADKYGDLYEVGHDWDGESVFDVQCTASGTQSDTNSPYYSYAIGPSIINSWGFYQPTMEFVNNFMVDDNGLPVADYTSKEPLTALKTVTEINSKGDEEKVEKLTSALDIAVDPRLDFTVGRAQVPYLDYGTMTSTNGWIRSAANGGYYLCKKPIPRKGQCATTSTPVNSVKNFHVIRLADIFLMYAECCIHDGDLATAQEYINKVRARAANDFMEADQTTPGSYSLIDKVNDKTVDGAAGTYCIGLYTTPFTSKEEAMTALKRERRVELGMEGHHWFDLARWGEMKWLNEVFRAYETKYMVKYDNPYGENWVTFPIPMTEIQTAEGRFVQNVNWK